MESARHDEGFKVSKVWDSGFVRGSYFMGAKMRLALVELIATLTRF